MWRFCEFGLLKYLRSLNFSVNRFFMKLFNTSGIQTVITFIFNSPRKVEKEQYMNAN